MLPRKEPMSRLIREHSEVVRRMEAGAAGAKFIEVEADKAPKPKRTYSLVWQEMPWCDGYNVRCDQTNAMMREEPFRNERLAQEYLEALEDGVEL